MINRQTRKHVMKAVVLRLKSCVGQCASQLSITVTKHLRQSAFKEERLILTHFLEVQWIIGWIYYFYAFDVMGSTSWEHMGEETYSPHGNERKREKDTRVP
jgi:hypothetical protein